MEAVENIEEAVAALQVPQPNGEAVRAFQRSQMISIADQASTIVEALSVYFRRRATVDALIRLESAMDALAGHKNATAATTAAVEHARTAIAGHRAYPRRRRASASKGSRLGERTVKPSASKQADGGAGSQANVRLGYGTLSSSSHAVEADHCERLMKLSQDLEDARAAGQLVESFMDMVECRNSGVSPDVRQELRRSLELLLGPDDRSTPTPIWQAADATCTPVFIGGFGWSGSGAVEDYLLGFDGVSRFSNSEVQLVNAKTLDGISLEALLACGRSTHQAKVDLVRWLARVTFGVAPDMTCAQAAYGHQRCLASDDLDDETVSRQYLAVATLVTILAQSGPDAEIGDVLSRTFPDFLNELVLARWPEADYCILGNLISPSTPDALRMLPSNCRYIAVTRDPRDMYIDRHAAGKLRWDPDDFSQRLATSLAGFDEFLTAAHVPTLKISFEEFLRSRTARSELVSFVFSETVDEDLQRAAEETDRFSLSASMQNVGKYKDHPRPDEIAAISAWFSD